MAQLKDCFEEFKKKFPELHAHLKEKSGGTYEGGTEGKDAYIRAIKELQQNSIDSVQDIYKQLNIQTNAIPKRSAEKTTLGETSGDSEKVGARISESEEPTRTQGKEKSQDTGEEKVTKGNGVYVQYPPTSLSYKGTAKIETEFGTEAREPTERKRDIYTIKEADQLLESGWDIGKELNKIDSGEKTFISDAEYINFTRYAAELSDRLRNMKDKTSPEFDKTLKELNRVAAAANLAGQQTGRALGIRGRFKTVADGSYGEFMLDELAANNDAPLTESQKKTANEEFEKLNAAREKLEKDTKEFEERVAAFKADQELAKTRKSKTGATKKTHEDFKKERESYKEELRAARKEHEEWLKSQGIAKSGIGFSLTTKDAIIIGKYIKSYAEEAALSIKEVAKRIIDEIKDIYPDLTEKDIIDVAAGVYNEKKITKREAAINMENLRIEAQLLNKYEALLKGEEPKNEKDKVKRNQAIEDLRKKLKDPSDLSAMQKRNEAETKKIKELIAKGDFSIPKKKTPLMEDKELQKKFPEQFERTKKAVDEYIKAKREIATRRLKQMYENRTPEEKTIEIFSKSLNVPRTLMASMDFSAPLRQGIVASAAHPQIASKALKFMFEAAKDEKVYNRWLEDVHNSPRWEWAEKTGLGITDPESLHVRQTEEAFQGAPYAEKIPILGAGVKASERAYIGFLNKMRWDLFNMYADRFEDQGKTFDNNKKLYEGLSSFINSETGRGGMKGLEGAAPVMNWFLFASKLISSRLNMLGISDIPNLAVRGATFGKYGIDYGFYTRLPKEIRIEAAKDMLKFVAVGIAALAIAKASGAEVEIDPRSSDFGKIKIGNTRYDIWGGFLQYARVITQVLSGQRKTTTTGEIQELDSKSFMGQNRLTPLVSFGRGKLAPVPASIIDISSGRDVIGNKVTLGGEALSAVTPLLIQDVYSAMQDQGVRGLFTVGVPAAFGVGVQTYQKREESAASSNKKPTKPTKSKQQKPTKQ